MKQMLARGRRALNRLPLATKIHLAMGSLLLATGIATTLLATAIAGNALTEETRGRAESLTVSLAARAIEPLLTFNLPGLNQLIDETVNSGPDIIYAFVLDSRGQVLAHSFPGNGFPRALLTVHPQPAAPSLPNHGPASKLLDTGSGLIHDFAVPVVLGNNWLGTARVGLTRASIQAARRELALAIIMAVGLVALLAVGLGSLFARTITRRLARLRAAAAEIMEGNLEPPLPTPRQGGDEIEDLATAFDFMTLALRDRLRQLHNTQHDLTHQQQLLQTIFDVTPDLVALQDLNGNYQAINQAFRRYMDDRPNPDQTLVTAAAATTPKGVIDPVEDRKVLSLGTTISREVMEAHPTNRRWFHVIKVPVRDQEGGIVGLLMTARDISELKNYQDQLIQSQKMEDLGRLAGGVAHEINTPLGIILGYTQMLLEDLPADSQSREDMLVIEKQTRICQQIVTGLLGFSRQGANITQSMDLNESVDEVVSLTRTIFSKEGVVIETEFDPTLPPIPGDREKLKSVWLNLLNNALAAIGQNGGILISSRLCAKDKRVVMAMVDTGSGISRENLAKVFTPFFTTKAAGKGTGLGLSIAFGVIRDHRGRITAHSPPPAEYLEWVRKHGHPGPGTAIIVELPLAGDDSSLEGAGAVPERIVAGG
ncbi:ATP-binding protein [Desulfurivibrio sp. D14AmB]|uniref:ATP-binding protein n=1 Tax=Desulfurivibrio sp. D14AmB TaxID=3374370 RepID=UPI00376ED09D